MQIFPRHGNELAAHGEGPRPVPLERSRRPWSPTPGRTDHAPWRGQMGCVVAGDLRAKRVASSVGCIRAAGGGPEIESLVVVSPKVTALRGPVRPRQASAPGSAGCHATRCGVRVAGGCRPTRGGCLRCAVVVYASDRSPFPCTVDGPANWPRGTPGGLLSRADRPHAIMVMNLP